ncbi:MAG: helix-turn-helix transcriptional regulator [Rubrivivax sp.]|nr:helix-turn-helix transcriptional regulator [Rubrivivax sp.]
MARREDWGGLLPALPAATLAAWAAALAQPARPAGDGGETTPTGERLTARELEVVALISRGQSNKLIARALDLSPHTVKRHVANSLGKLGVVSRAPAAAWYHALQR